MTAGPNLVLYGELTADLVGTLTAVMRIVEQGDDETAANVARSELPGLVEDRAFLDVLRAGRATAAAWRIIRLA